MGPQPGTGHSRRNRPLVSDSPALSTDHRALRDVVGGFVDRHVIPTVAERERADAYPADLLRKLADLGVLGMSIPETYGGSELDLVGYALVFEELARGWMGLASIVGSSNSGCWLIARYGTEQQRQHYLPDLAGGRRMSGIALTEPSTGSDLKAVRVVAARRGDDVVVSGTKTLITQARHADPLVVLVVTDSTAVPAHRGHEPAARRAGHARVFDRRGHRQARPPGRGALRGRVRRCCRARGEPAR